MTAEDRRRREQQHAFRQHYRKGRHGYPREFYDGCSTVQQADDGQEYVRATNGTAVKRCGWF